MPTTKHMQKQKDSGQRAAGHPKSLNMDIAQTKKEKPKRKTPSTKYTNDTPTHRDTLSSLSCQSFSVSFHRLPREAGRKGLPTAPSGFMTSVTCLAPGFPVPTPRTRALSFNGPVSNAGSAGFEEFTACNRNENRRGIEPMTLLRFPRTKVGSL